MITLYNQKYKKQSSTILGENNDSTCITIEVQYKIKNKSYVIIAIGAWDKIFFYSKTMQQTRELFCLEIVVDEEEIIYFEKTVAYDFFV